jgi:hypothetical protein
MIQHIVSGAQTRTASGGFSATHQAKLLAGQFQMIRTGAAVGYRQETDLPTLTLQFVQQTTGTGIGIIGMGTDA